jgi:hypothetical protein
MPLIQGGPPEWIWERAPEKLRWEVVASERPEGVVLGLRQPGCATAHRGTGT